MAEVAIKLNLKVEDLIGIIKQLPLGERERLKEWLDREGSSRTSDSWDSEALLLSESPTFRAINTPSPYQRFASQICANDEEGLIRAGVAVMLIYLRCCIGRHYRFINRRPISLFAYIGSRIR